MRIRIHDPLAQLTICSMSAAPGWGPGRPRRSSPLATFALNSLCTRTISSFSARVSPVPKTEPPQAVPKPCTDRKIQPLTCLLKFFFTVLKTKFIWESTCRSCHFFLSAHACRFRCSAIVYTSCSSAQLHSSHLQRLLNFFGKKSRQGGLLLAHPPCSLRCTQCGSW